jgi:hypothetical protein
MMNAECGMIKKEVRSQNPEFRREKRKSVGSSFLLNSDPWLLDS